MPHLTIEVACTPAQLTEIETKRSALQATAKAGDLAAIDQLAAETHLTYALVDTKKKVNSMNVIAVIRKIAEIRLLKSQIKNYIELTCDMDALKLEDPTCNKRTSTSVANQVVNYQPSIGNFMMLKTKI